MALQELATSILFVLIGQSLGSGIRQTGCEKTERDKVKNSLDPEEDARRFGPWWPRKNSAMPFRSLDGHLGGVRFRNRSYGHR
jgi:hypothetical protein